MRRTKEWWARVELKDRDFLGRYEANNAADRRVLARYGALSSHDLHSATKDCQDIGEVTQPTSFWYGKFCGYPGCPSCDVHYKAIIRKANGEES